MMIKLDMIKNNDNYHKSFTVMSNYICLRFGYCNSKSQGDFIDNINADLNIYLATGTDDNQKEFLLCYINDDFFVLPNESINGNLDKLSNRLSNFLDKKIAKGLIKSGHENDADGIIDYAPEYKDYFFDAQENDSVESFAPCYFVITSITMKCDCKINIKTGNIIYEKQKINNLCDFFGVLDEDEIYTIGIKDYKNKS